MKHKFKISIEGEVEDTWESDERGTVTDEEKDLIQYIKESLDFDPQYGVDFIETTLKIEILK